MKRLSDWLYSYSSGRVALLSLALFLGFTAAVLPRQSTQTEVYSAGVGSVDLRFFYSAVEVYEIAEAYGDAGREAYVRARLTFDTAWPLIYTFFLSVTTGFLFRKALPENSPWLKINLLPVAAMLFDYLENISISVVMLAYPSRLTFLAGLTAVFTAVKWVLVGASFAALFVGLVLLGVKRLQMNQA